jgi:hypothetical protein
MCLDSSSCFVQPIVPVLCICTGFRFSVLVPLKLIKKTLLSAVHKSRGPGHHGNYILYGGIYCSWFLSMKLLHGTHLAPWNLMWLLDFCKICSPVPTIYYSNFFFTLAGYLNIMYKCSIVQMFYIIYLLEVF